jgi:hypothetical protein
VGCSGRKEAEKKEERKGSAKIRRKKMREGKGEQL